MSISYVYCDVHGKELEERSADGWEIVEGKVKVHPYFGPAASYLLRRQRELPPQQLMKKELEKLHEERTDMRNRLQRLLASLESACSVSEHKFWPENEPNGRGDRGRRLTRDEVAEAARGIRPFLVGARNTLRDCLGEPKKP